MMLTELMKLVESKYEGEINRFGLILMNPHRGRVNEVIISDLEDIQVFVSKEGFEDYVIDTFNDFLKLNYGDEMEISSIHPDHQDEAPKPVRDWKWMEKHEAYREFRQQVWFKWIRPD